MKLTEKWLIDPTKYLEQYSGVRMWDAEANVTRDGILTFGVSPGKVTPQVAKLILAENDAGFGVTFFSNTMLSGIHTHYERRAFEVEFNSVLITDEDPGVVKLFGPENNVNGLVLPVEPARMVTWSLCNFVNRKTS